MFARLGAKVACGFGARRKLLILTYHRVLDRADCFINDITAETFSKQIKVLSENFKVLRLDEAAALLAQNRLPSNAVCITFDDGYADNYDRAYPILKSYAVPATFFVATGFIDGGIMWNDIVRYACKMCSEDDIRDYLRSLNRTISTSLEQAKVELMHETISDFKYQDIDKRDHLAREFSKILSVQPRDTLMMTREQVADLSHNGMEVGAHTVNHPILKNLSQQQARYEIDESRAYLEDIIGKRVVSFAFPNGRPGIDFDQSHVELLSQTGFEVAVTTEFAAAGYSDKLLALPRLGLWDNSPARISLRLINYFARY